MIEMLQNPYIAVSIGLLALSATIAGIVPLVLMFSMSGQPQPQPQPMKPRLPPIPLRTEGSK